jgi:hypothetical protein
MNRVSLIGRDQAGIDHTDSAIRHIARRKPFFTGEPPEELWAHNEIPAPSISHTVPSTQPLAEDRGNSERAFV